MNFYLQYIGNHNYSTSNNENSITVQDRLSLILCKYKHGSIRFKPTIRTISNEVVCGWISPLIPGTTQEEVRNVAKEKAENLLDGGDYYKASTNVRSQLFKSYKGIGYITPDKIGEWSGSTYYGRTYCTTPIWTALGNEDKKNDKQAYILSSGPEFSPIGDKIRLKEGNYDKTYSDTADEQLIQDALWKDLGGFNEGDAYTANNPSADALLEEAKDYEDYYKSIKGSSDANITNSDYKTKVETHKENAQVIVNRNDSNPSKSYYILGPFTVKYPDDHRFSYIEDMYLEIKEQYGNEATTRDFTIITEEGEGKIPDSGELFWVKLDAQKHNYPTSANLKVTFAYLAGCQSKYTTYNGEGKIYQIIGTLTKEEDTSRVAYQQTSWFDDNKNGIEDPGERRVTKNYYYYRYIFSTSEKYLGKYTAQKLAELTSRNRIWRKYTVSVTGGDMDLTMELGGFVWEDHVYDKETEGNNINDQEDIPMNNVIVTLYQQDDKGNISIAKLRNFENSQEKQQTQNPTKTGDTGEDGRYNFTGLNAMYRYYVEFTYNSQYYQPVEYVSPTDKTNGIAYKENGKWNMLNIENNNWKQNSNGTDVKSERTTINARFSTIGSSPNNYISKNSNYQYGNNDRGFNKTYSKEELLGNKLNTNGEYERSSDLYQIIDKFGNLLYNKDGKAIVKNSSNQEILVSSLSGNAKIDVESKIQYVKDCQLNSYTGKDKEEKRNNDLYPIYNIFVLDTSANPYISRLSRINSTYTNGYTSRTIPTLYKDERHLYINQGYVARQEAELIVQKEISKVVLEINDQNHTYWYDQVYKNKIDKTSGDYDNYWTVPERLKRGYYYMEDKITERYYTREIYESDYLYKVSMYGDKQAQEKLGKLPSDDELDVYVTYRIMINNNSQSIRCRIDELVDYYDDDYEFVEDRSYVKVQKGEDEINKYSLNWSNSSRYGQSTETRIDGYDKLYLSEIGKNSNFISGDSSKLENSNDKGMYLYSGETLNVFLTFKVEKEKLEDDEYWLKLKDEKGNVVEINGYSTIYGNGTKVQNVGTVDGTKAGIVDKASNPGNLKADTVINKKYQEFENDTDKAPAMRFVVNNELKREISGTVWEDERTEKVYGAIVGNGENDENKPINGVTVQLVEIMDNGEEFIWREFGDVSIIEENGNYIYTYGKEDRESPNTGSGINQVVTPIIDINSKVPQNAQNIVAGGKMSDASIEDKKGQYKFISFAPGKYIVRFKYGDTEKTVVPQGYNNNTSYNGQDYKSTTYQKGINQEEINSYKWNRWKWDNDKEEFVQDGNTIATIDGYKNKNCSQNESVKIAINKYPNEAYLYDIAKAQNNDSDAKDIESIRDAVIEYSDDNVRNHIAEVLATRDNNSNLYNEFVERTEMTAETGLIVMEFEYNTKETENQGAINKLEYVVSNVDLGLEERPKAQLVIDKKVVNVKLVLADGTTLFDASGPSTNVLWKDHEIYKTGYTNNKMHEATMEKLRKNNVESILGYIQMSLDEELMHGATIKITYSTTIRNVGEVDYKENKFYYTGEVEDIKNVVKTSADTVIEYVGNNLQFSAKDNAGWEVIKQEELITSDDKENLVRSDLKNQIEKYNTIIKTEKFSETKLVPELYSENISKDNGNYSVSQELLLTQLITSENTTDDLTYRTITEIVKVSNDVGRRMQYSIVGNQNPEEPPAEVDSDIPEKVQILPPFGNNNAIRYIIIAITIIMSVGILSAGIIFIKKKVLK